MHRDGLEQAGEPSAHSTGKRQSAGTQTREHTERVRECGAYRERRRVGRCRGYWKATGNCCKDYVLAGLETSYSLITKLALYTSRVYEINIMLLLLR